MPIYEYSCSECEHKFERFVRSMNAQADVCCPKCGSDQVKKAFSVFGVSNGTKSSVGSSSNSCAPTGG